MKNRKKLPSTLSPYRRVRERMPRKFMHVLLLLFVSLSAHSQITVSVRNESLRASLKRVEQASVYKFFFNENLPELNQQVSFNVVNASIDQTMQVLLSGMAITYNQEKNNIIVLMKKSREQQQSKKVSGMVVDEKGEPIIGASVMVKGTPIGTITDLEGRYSLNDVSETAVLTISYIGYKTIMLAVKDRAIARTILQEDSKLIDEVVVVGYGVQRKSDITGSVSSIKSSELLSAPNSTATQALQGRVAGVVVQNTSGSPSDGAIIRVRGANSLTYGNDPLVIIDGVQDGNIGSLNPNQIESIEVLKDAAAVSVYGSKGANGVILISTKNGKMGKPQLSYNGFVSFDQVRKTLPSLDATRYAGLLNEAQRENGLNPLFSEEQIKQLGAGTDWQSHIFRDALSHNHNVSFSGAQKMVSYFIAGGITDKQGIILNSDFKQYTLRANFKMEATSRLNLSFNTFASYDETRNGDYGAALNAALQWSPTKPIYDSNSSGGYSQPGGGVGPVSLYNPVGYAKEIIDEKSKSFFSVSLMGEYKFWDFLKLSTLLAYRTSSNTAGYFDNQLVNNGPSADVSGSKEQARYMALQSTSILTFNKIVGKHSVQATGVYEILKDNYQRTSASAKGIPVALGYNGLQFGSTLQQPWTEYINTAMQSFMGRVNYSYNNRYMLSASIRYDGASQLADGHKYDSFTAISAGWNVMEEPFMKNIKDIIPEFKIRGSYGTVGNAAVPAYASQLKFTPGLDANNNPTLSVSQLSNKDLRWERTKETNIGIDSRWWNGRFTFSAEYYDKRTTDLLMWQKVPAALGVSSILTNVGSVSNKGFDFSIGGTPVSTKSFKWDVNYTLNFNKNKILKLDGLTDMLIYSSHADYPGLVGSFVQMIGQPMGTFLGYTYAGVWQQSEISNAALYGAKPGDAKYVDTNKDGKIDKGDIGVIGNAQPKFSYGLNNTFSFYTFDLNIFWQGVYGNDIYNQNRIRRESYSSSSFPTSPQIADHWTPSNPSNVPSFSGIEQINSSRWVEDGSYLRLKNITLGYRFPTKVLSKISCSSARLYVSANNLWTITRYTGFDPESSIGTDAVAAGVDRGIYPSSKSFLIGLDISF